MSTTSHLRVILVAATVAVGALTLSGCSAISGFFPHEAARDSETQEISEAGEADVFTIGVGDCFNDQDADQIATVEAVPCGEAHDNEAYFAFDVNDEVTYPGTEVVETAADDGCLAEFTTFVGLSYEESVLDFQYLTPTEDGWASGDHEVVCVVYDTGMTTGSLAGVAR